MDGTLTVAEFCEAAEGLLAVIGKYNGEAEEGDPIDARLHRIPANTAYLTTAPVYLELFGAVQVFYSPSFQTPVAHFALERVHNVPAAAGFGVAKVSHTEHPVTGLPCCYLHPCQTAQVMGELKCQSPTEYLLKWLGVYSNDLSLHSSDLALHGGDFSVQIPHTLFTSTIQALCTRYLTTSSNVRVL